MNKKKNLKKAATGLLLSAIVVGGASAFLTTSKVDTNVHNITAGTFVLDILNEGAGVLDAKAFPVSTAVGEASTPYTFSLKNSGTIDMVARLSGTAVAAADLAHTELPKAKIMVRIDKLDAGAGPKVNVYNGTLEEFEALTAGEGAGEVIRLAAGATENFELRTYISETAVNDDLYGVGGDETRSIKFQVKVDAVQAEGGIGGVEGFGAGFTPEDITLWDTSVKGQIIH